MVIAIGMYFHIGNIQNNSIGLFGTTPLKEIVQMCNAGWGDSFNVTFSCVKVQLFYYSPWIAGFFGLIFLLKAGSQSGYRGAGGYGSHNRRRK